MTLDSSALIAVLFAEPGHLDLVDRILEADHVRVGAPTLVETSLVHAGRRSSPAAGEVEDLVRELGVTVGDTLLYVGDDFGHTDIARA